MKINFDQIKQIHWSDLIKRNRYSLVSIMILIGYFYFVFLAVSFVVKNMRDAFFVGRETAAGQTIGFDIENYEKISRRFSE